MSAQQNGWFQALLEQQKALLTLCAPLPQYQDNGHFDIDTLLAQIQQQLETLRVKPPTDQPTSSDQQTAWFDAAIKFFVQNANQAELIQWQLPPALLHILQQPLTGPWQHFSDARQAQDHETPYNDTGLQHWHNYQVALAEYMALHQQINLDAAQQLSALLSEQDTPITSLTELHRLWAITYDRVYADAICTPEYSKKQGEMINKANELMQFWDTQRDQQADALGLVSQTVFTQALASQHALRKELRQLKRIQMQQTMAETQRQQALLATMQCEIRALKDEVTRLKTQLTNLTSCHASS